MAREWRIRIQLPVEYLRANARGVGESLIVGLAAIGEVCSHVSPNGCPCDVKTATAEEAEEWQRIECGRNG